VTGFNEIRKADRIGHIGYWLGREHQGRGIMIASVRALMNHGFKKLGLNRQCISAAVDNVRSRAIPEHLGFRFEGIAREAEWVYDHFKDLARYAITLREWQSQTHAPP
jgi:ribosomal-protein-serine acetyltransferase